MIHSISFSLAILQISLTGNINAVELVIWLKNIIFVLSVIPSVNCFTNSLLDTKGSFISCCLYLAPVFLQIKDQVLSKAPYSWLVVKISSYGLNCKLLITVFKAVDGLGEKSRSLVLHPT